MQTFRKPTYLLQIEAYKTFRKLTYLLQTEAYKADTAGEPSEGHPQSLRRGSGDGMYTRNACATREALLRG
jgi:hypothetical protein